MNEAVTATLAERAGKYLTFHLAEEGYGVEILKVQEIIGLMNITRVPRAPDFVRGVINLRGKVIPVVDLRLKFAMPSREFTARTCIIVVEIELSSAKTTMGIIVDEVSEVVNVTADQIEPPPSFGVAVDTDFILGMGKIGGRVLILLDIDKVLSSADAALIARINQSE